MNDVIGWCVWMVAGILATVVAAGVIDLLGGIVRGAGLHGDVIAGAMLVISILGAGCGVLFFVGLLTAINRIGRNQWLR